MLQAISAAASLYTTAGKRKYLTPPERTRFIAAAENHARGDAALLCLVLAYTGCRVSEALALTASSVEIEGGFIAFRSLKKRGGAAVIREVPIPPALLARLARWIEGAAPETRLWNFQRCRAWQLVKEVMCAADIAGGVHATPKGLRHGFGVHAIQSGVPLNLVQRWLGHARMETTAIYLDVMGNEERALAARMWGPGAPTHH